MKTLIWFLMFVAFSANAVERLHSKKWYVNQDCLAPASILKGSFGAVCVTDDEVQIYDYANKWRNTIGRSLHYAKVTGKRPSVVLIVEKKSDCRYSDKLCVITESLIFANDDKFFRIGVYTTPIGCTATH